MSNVLNISGLGAGLEVYAGDAAVSQAVEQIAYDLGLPQYIEALNDFRNKLPNDSALKSALIDPKLCALLELINYRLDSVPALRPDANYMAVGGRAGDALIEAIESYNRHI